LPPVGFKCATGFSVDENGTTGFEVNSWKVSFGQNLFPLERNYLKQYVGINLMENWRRHSQDTTCPAISRCFEEDINLLK
jgi:hypothetical protein